ncbi:MAG: laccase domain-containing protein [Coriobacteriia bacterium]|nr:laccase domain-containing protein [Coriobacteriia bacterium]
MQGRSGPDVFERVVRDGVAIHTVPGLFESHGIGIAFTERTGGASKAPYDSLNLAQHVGDDPRNVDASRERLLASIGIGVLRDRLTMAEQVHGSSIVEVTGSLTGAGARATGVRPPLPGVDGLWTREQGVPLMLLFADCVPVVLVRPSVPAVAVVHAGWKGVAAGIVGRSAGVLAELAGEDDLSAFVGPHIGTCCYEVGQECLSHFDSAFVTITAVSPHLDLGAAVASDLERSGVPRGRQWHLGICTAHNTDRFYSYRANGLTGRHGALAVIL